MSDYATAITLKSNALLSEYTGNQIGGYRLNQHLGVNQFIGNKDGELYWIKVFIKDRSELCRHLSQIKCDSVIPLIEFGKEGDYFFEVYPYLKTNAISLNLNDEKTMKELTRQIYEAIYALHNQGLIHGDIKPTNILFDESGKVMLCDFDISQLTETGEAWCDDERTREYAPPIEIHGVSGKIRKTFAYDYASFGMTLLDLITDQCHFKNKNDDEILDEWKRGIYMSHTVPRDMQILIAGLTEYNEKKRFGAKEIELWLNNKYVSKKTEADLTISNTESVSLVIAIENSQAIRVNSIEELALQIPRYWESFKKRFLVRPDSWFKLIEFVKQWDQPGMPSKAEQIEDILNKTENLDVTITKIITILQGKNSIVYKGMIFDDINDLFRAVSADTYDEPLADYLCGELFEQYLQEQGKDDIRIGIEELKSVALDDKELLYYLIAIGQKESINVMGYKISNCKDMADCLLLNASQINPKDIKKVLAWLYWKDKEENVRLVRRLVWKYEQ